MNPIRILTLLLPALILAACASAPTTPDWTHGNSARYPAAKYLLGHGQAASLEEAKDRARADIAKGFQVAVVVSTDDTQESHAGTAGARFEEHTSRNISTRTDQLISGIQIAELWQDPATQKHHALAVLPRLQTAASLRQQITALDEDTRKFIAQSRNQSDALLKIGAATEALQLQQQRGVLQKQLQVVDITGRGMEAPWPIATLQTDLLDQLKRVRIAVQTASDAPAALREMTAGALAQAGYLPDASGQPQYTLQVRMELNDLGMHDGWYWQRGIVEVVLSETGSGRTRGTRQWNIKGNASTRAGAVQRALSQADAQLKQELGRALIEMASARN